jgi:hypothetical protein
MRTTTQQEDKDFIQALDFGALLEQAADYIAENFPPEDVYEERQLRNWALDNGFVEKEE